MTETDDEDDVIEEPRHLTRRLLLIVRYLLKHLNRMEKDIMAAIDDLNAQVDTLQATVTNVATEVDTLRQGQGTPDPQIQAVGAKLQPIIDQLNALAVPPAPAPAA